MKPTVRGSCPVYLAADPGDGDIANTNLPAWSIGMAWEGLLEEMVFTDG
jgi:hypothetical protein